MLCLLSKLHTENLKKHISAHHVRQLHQPEQVLQDPHAQRTRTRARIVKSHIKINTGSSPRHQLEKVCLTP